MLRASSALFTALIACVSCLTACNKHQPAQKPEVTQASSTSSAINSGTTKVVAPWLAIKEVEYGDSGLVIALGAQLLDASRNPAVTWVQTAGPKGTLINAKQLDAAVVLPFVAQPTTLKFALTATSNGESITAVQAITVLPLPSRVQVSNPLLTISDTFAPVQLVNSVPANTQFTVVSVSGSVGVYVCVSVLC